MFKNEFQVTLTTTDPVRPLGRGGRTPERNIDAVRELNFSINRFADASGALTEWLIAFTVVLVVLTIVIVFRG